MCFINDYKMDNTIFSIDNPLQVIGVLDWEFAGWGDPMEDVAWFCAKCWRFGFNNREAGGMGSRAAFYDAYENASSRTIDHEAINFWEISEYSCCTKNRSNCCPKFRKCKIFLTVPDAGKTIVSWVSPASVFSPQNSFCHRNTAQDMSGSML